MARFILWIILFLTLYAILRILLPGTSGWGKKLHQKTEPEELVQDPNCQTYIPKRSAVKKRIAGRFIYFCDRECMEEYVKRIKNS